MCSASFVLHTDCSTAGNQSLLKHDWSKRKRTPSFENSLNVANTHICLKYTLESSGTPFCYCAKYLNRETNQTNFTRVSLHLYKTLMSATQRKSEYFLSWCSLFCNFRNLEQHVTYSVRYTNICEEFIL